MLRRLQRQLWLKAARLLDTTERVLNYKVRKLGVDYQRFKV